MKNLIIYYSYEGNTEALVNGMKQVIDADILKLIPLKERKTKSLFRFIWGGIQVYMTKKPKLKPYNIDLNEYKNIIIACPCWYGTYAPPINTFLHENNLTNKNIYLLVSNGGNLRNTWQDFEHALNNNKIISKLDIIYPIKNGIEESQNKVNTWLKDKLK